MSAGGSVAAVAVRPTSSRSTSFTELPVSAASRAPVAELEVADEWRGPCEQGDGTGHRRVAFDLGLAGHGADAQGSVAPLDTPQVAHPVEVDHVIEAGQAQGHDRHQALAAR